jgi:hypothetical protein
MKAISIHDKEKQKGEVLTRPLSYHETGNKRMPSPSDAIAKNMFGGTLHAMPLKTKKDSPTRENTVTRHTN